MLAFPLQSQPPIPVKEQLVEIVTAIVKVIVHELHPSNIHVIVESQDRNDWNTEHPYPSSRCALVNLANGCSECFCILSIVDSSLKSPIPTNRWPAFSYPSSEAWDSLKAE